MNASDRIHFAATPVVVQAAERGDPAAIQRAHGHAAAWLASGQPLLGELRARLYRRAVAIVGGSLVIKERAL